MTRADALRLVTRPGGFGEVLDMAAQIDVMKDQLSAMQTALAVPPRGFAKLSELLSGKPLRDLCADVSANWPGYPVCECAVGALLSLGQQVAKLQARVAELEAQADVTEHQQPRAGCDCSGQPITR